MDPGVKVNYERTKALGNGGGYLSTEQRVSVLSSVGSGRDFTLKCVNFSPDMTQSLALTSLMTFLCFFLLHYIRRRKHWTNPG